MKVILFSPTGGTKKVADAICKGIGEEVSVIDFCNREKRNEKIKCEEGEFAVIAFPVFGGRIPALAAQRLKEVEANGAKCALLQYMATGLMMMPWLKCKICQSPADFVLWQQ